MKNIFAVSPQSVRFNLKPGEEISGTIQITNPVDAENNVNYKIETAPYNVTDEDNTADLENVNQYSDIKDWVTIDEPTGIIEPNSVKTINYAIKVPEDAAGGGHYFAFLIKNTPEAGNESGTAVQIQSALELSSIVYATVDGEIRREGEILESELPLFSFTNPLETTVTVKNTGNIHQDVLIKTKVTNFFTGEEEVLRINGEDDGEISFIVMPGASRFLNLKVSGLTDLGVFHISQTISFNGNEITNSHLLFMCPLWFVGIVGLAILATIGAFIRRKLENFKPKHGRKGN